MTVLFAFIAALCIFAGTISLIIFVIGPVMLLNPRRRGTDYYRSRGEPITPKDVNLTFDEFWFHGKDNVLLHAWYVPTSRPHKGTIIYLHGVGDNKIGGILLAKVFVEHGFNVFLYDSRAHGMSRGKYCTYGYHEKHDVQHAITTLFERQGDSIGNIGVFGTSMGAAIAVQAGAIEPRIAAIVAEGCFTNLRTITVDYQKRLIRLPWHFLRNIVMKRSEFLAQFRHHDVSPLKALASIVVPMMFIHGKDDTFIKYQYSEALFAAASEPKDMYLVEGAMHNNVHSVGKKDYEEHLVQFFEKWLSSEIKNDNSKIKKKL